MAGKANRDDARALALDLLRGVLVQRLSLAELEVATPVQEAAAPSRARAGRLARATLRHLGQADAALKPHLHRAPRPDIKDILRLATVEMLVEGEAAHGVVHDAVARARRRQSKAAGMVNAVLRRVAEMDPAAFSQLSPQRMPNWLRGRLSAAYGNARVARMEAVHASNPPLDVTLRAGATPADWAERLGATVLPTGSLRLGHVGQVSLLPGYAEGQWWVQDAAAALPARLIGARPGLRVLDLCAAPGGKTLQLAASGAAVTALDVSDARLDRLRENLARTGLSAEIVVADAFDWAPEGSFDAILVDAPCSATGTLRRHPDLPFVKDASALKTLVPLQRKMVDRAARWLAPGGRMVICTCSLLPDEGEQLIDELLQGAPDLRRDGANSLPGAEPLWSVGPGTFRITPESWAARGGIDGFFISALVKSA